MASAVFEQSQIMKDWLELLSWSQSSESNGRASCHGSDSPSATVPTRHHLEQAVVGAAEDAQPTVLGHPRHVGEHQTVIQLAAAPKIGRSPQA